MAYSERTTMPIFRSVLVGVMAVLPLACSDSSQLLDAPPGADTAVDVTVTERGTDGPIVDLAADAAVDLAAIDAAPKPPDAPPVDTAAKPPGLPSFVISSAADQQLCPAVGYDGTNYMVAWSDCRNGNACGIYGSRVDQSGQVLDPSGLLIADSQTHDKETPRLAFDGTNFLVVYDTSVLYAGKTRKKVYGVRISKSGAVLDSTPIGLSLTGQTAQDPAVAFNGSSYLVVWRDYRNGSDYDIYGARVSPAGQTLDPAGGFAIATGSSNQEHVSVAHGTTSSLVVWRDHPTGSYNTRAARVSPTGSVLDVPALAVHNSSSYTEETVVAFDGTSFLIAWDISDVKAARVSATGQILDTSPIGVVPSSSPLAAGGLAAAFGGGSFLLLWEKPLGVMPSIEKDVYGARVSSAGAVLDATGIPMATKAKNQNWPALAFGASQHLVVWTEHLGTTGLSDIHGALFTP